MDKFEIKSVKDYFQAKFPVKNDDDTPRCFMCKFISKLKVTFKVALVVLFLMFPTVNTACAGYTPPPPQDISGNEPVVKITLAQLSESPRKYDTSRVQMQGSIAAKEERSKRGRKRTVYFLENGGISLRLLGDVDAANVGKAVTVQGYIRIYGGEPCKDGIKSMVLSIEKIEE